MSAPLYARYRKYHRQVIPSVHVAVVLSLLFHALLMFGWLPKIPLLHKPEDLPGKPNAPLSVRLTPRPGGTLAPPPSPAPQTPTVAAARARPAPARRPLMPSSATPVLATERPAAPSVPAASPAPAQDFSATVKAKQRSREAEASKESMPAPPVETAQERDNRIAAINLGLNRTPTFGDEKKHGGGVFQVARVGFNDAEFFFFGWNKSIRRNSQQMIEVRRGDNPTTELAVVRKMIAIIREHEKEDFTWESSRLKRDVRLSARLSDNAELEAFMMQEFFSGARPRN